MLEESDDVQAFIRDHPTDPDSHIRTIVEDAKPKESKESLVSEMEKLSID